MAFRFNEASKKGVRAFAEDYQVTELGGGRSSVEWTMAMDAWHRKDLLGIAELEPAEIDLVLRTAASFHEVVERPIKKVPTLRGKTVLNLFFEPSTRTRSSFEIAEKRMSADAINFSTASSSLSIRKRSE